jgi:hypothetical protein
VRRQRVVLSLAAWDRSGRHLSRDCGRNTKESSLASQEAESSGCGTAPIGRQRATRDEPIRRSAAAVAPFGGCCAQRLLGPDRQPRDLAHSVQQR